MMTAILGLVAMVALMALFTIFFYWYCRWIRDRRIDVYTDPEWTSVTGPASPHSLLDPDTSLGKPPKYYDDHVYYRPDE
ncbi:hypothetical protein JF781_20585 [Mycobacterium sp. WUMAC-067]|nr:hypothetical protein [Mycobacterium sp. WUMAC-067]MCA2244760.1 hypothetical protein [Mycobacterium sp. WUMAC-067]MCA2316336.1 hypothetical protein [Mycobacterium sp. WUMAC-025]